MKRLFELINKNIIQELIFARKKEVTIHQDMPIITISREMGSGGRPIAQMVVKSVLEPEWDPRFHPSSFGYRPKKSAHDAVRQARANCWKHGWVVDLDIKGFFDNLDHDLLMKAVRHMQTAAKRDAARRRNQPAVGQPLFALCVR